MCLASALRTIHYHGGNYRVSPKKVLFRNSAVFLFKGVWAVKLWVFWGAEHIYAITWCLVSGVIYPMCLHYPHFSPLNLQGVPK